MDLTVPSEFCYLRSIPEIEVSESLPFSGFRTHYTSFFYFKIQIYKLNEYSLSLFGGFSKHMLREHKETSKVKKYLSCFFEIF